MSENTESATETAYPGCLYTGLGLVTVGAAVVAPVTHQFSKASDTRIERVDPVKNELSNIVAVGGVPNPDSIARARDSVCSLAEEGFGYQFANNGCKELTTAATTYQPWDNNSVKETIAVVQNANNDLIAPDLAPAYNIGTGVMTVLALASLVGIAATYVRSRGRTQPRYGH